MGKKDRSGESFPQLNRKKRKKLAATRKGIKKREIKESGVKYAPPPSKRETADVAASLRVVAPSADSVTLACHSTGHRIIIEPEIQEESAPPAPKRKGMIARFIAMIRGNR